MDLAVPVVQPQLRTQVLVVRVLGFRVLEFRVRVWALGFRIFRV